MKKDRAYYKQKIADDLGKALKEMALDFAGEPIDRDITLLLGRFNDMEDSFFKTLIGPEQKEIRYNILLNATLRLVETLEDAQTGPAEKPERINVPDYDFHDLVDRVDLTESIHGAWDEGRGLLLLRGVRGIGKTSIALAYCHRPEYAGRFDRIAWVSVMDDLQTDLMNALNDTPLGFRYNEKGSAEENFRNFIHSLKSQDGNNLLVVDGANDPKQILACRRQLESTKWKVLITTTALPDDCHILEVQELKTEFAKKLFHNHYKKPITEEHLLEAILQKIDYHTLLITLISKSGKKNPQLNIQMIHEILHDKEALKKEDLQSRITIERLGQSGYLTTEETRLFEFITAFFDFSLLNEDELACLTYFSALPSFEIPADRILEILQLGGYGTIEAIDTLNSLVEKGWLQANDEELDENAGVYYKCHQLIQVASREKLSPNASNCKPVLEYFARFLDDDLEEYAYDKKTHFPYLEALMDTIHDDCEELAAIHVGYGEVLFKFGDRKNWKDYYQKAFEIRRRLYPEDSVPLAQSYLEAGIVLTRSSRYAEAEEWLEKAQTIFQTAGQIKPLVEVRKWMARNYRSRGNYPESERKYLEVLEVIQQQSNPLELATLYEGLGMTYSKWGKLNDSLDYRLKCLAIRKAHLPANHPKMAIIYNNLGLVYNKMGDIEKARFYLETAIEIKKDNFGEEFSELGISYHNLSRVYGNLHQFDKALEAAEKGLKLKREWHEDHQVVTFAFSYDALTGIYFKMKDLEKAREYSNLTLEIRKKRYDPSNKDLQSSLELSSLIDLCQIEQAYRTFRRSFSLREDITPVNLAAEKERFLTSFGQGQPFNPVFQYEERSFDAVLPVLDDFQARFRTIGHPLARLYERKVSDEIEWIRCFQERNDGFADWLSDRYGFPEPSELEFARDLLATTQNPGSSPGDLEPSDALETVKQKLEEDGLHEWEVILAPMVAKISVNSVQKRISLNPEARFSQTEVKRLLVHEVDSHVLRHENGNRQPYSLFATGFPEYLATEEGLAILAEKRSGFFSPADQIKYALRLVLSDLCREGSFVDLFRYAHQFISADAAFDMVARIKRGLTDTATPGGYTKDQVYLKGFLSVKDLPDETLRRLFIGKIGLEHLDMLGQIPHLYQQYPLPEWLQHDRESS